MLKEGEYITLFPHETVMILTGVYMELPEPKDCGDYMEIMEAQVRPRSGLSLKESKVAILGTVMNIWYQKKFFMFVQCGNLKIKKIYTHIFKLSKTNIQSILILMKQ